MCASVFYHTHKTIISIFVFCFDCFVFKDRTSPNSFFFIYIFTHICDIQTCLSFPKILRNNLKKRITIKKTSKLDLCPRYIITLSKKRELNTNSEILYLHLIFINIEKKRSYFKFLMVA